MLGSCPGPMRFLSILSWLTFHVLCELSVDYSVLENAARPSILRQAAVDVPCPRGGERWRPAQCLPMSRLSKFSCPDVPTFLLFRLRLYSIEQVSPRLLDHAVYREHVREGGRGRSNSRRIRTKCAHVNRQISVPLPPRQLFIADRHLL